MAQALLCGGASAMSLVAAFFFYRFWRVSADRLFVYFALGFTVLSVHWAALGRVGPQVESRPELFVVRLAGFLLILLGIIDKNRQGPPST